MHTRISRKEAEEGISLEEWNTAVKGFDGFIVSDVLIQQNPFSKEFMELESPGSGYWISDTNDAPEWPGKGKVVFRRDEQGITFIQYKNCENEILNSLANSLGAEVYAYEIG